MLTGAGENHGPRTGGWQCWHGSPQIGRSTQALRGWPERKSLLQRPNGTDFLVLRTTRDLSHIPKHVAITVRIAMVEGSTVSRGVPADTGIAIPSAQNPIPNAQICSIFIRLPFPPGYDSDRIIEHHAILSAGLRSGIRESSSWLSALGTV